MYFGNFFRSRTVWCWGGGGGGGEVSGLIKNMLVCSHAVVNICDCISFCDEELGLMRVCYLLFGNILHSV